MALNDGRCRMIGINKQCEMCRNLKTDSDGGQKFYYCEKTLILDEDEEKICLGFDLRRYEEDNE